MRVCTRKTCERASSMTRVLPFLSKKSRSCSACGTPEARVDTRKSEKRVANGAALAMQPRRRGRGIPAPQGTHLEDLAPVFPRVVQGGPELLHNRAVLGTAERGQRGGAIATGSALPRSAGASRRRSAATPDSQVVRELGDLELFRGRNVPRLLREAGVHEDLCIRALSDGVLAAAREERTEEGRRSS